MRALLTPFIQRELGVVILKPGADLLPYMSGRLLVATEPDEFKSLPVGVLPVANQQLANDPRLLPFFEHERVINAAGGPRVLEAWVKQLKECQWHDPDDSHVQNLTTLSYGQRSIRLCWHHDNKLREHTLPRLNQLATSNLITWIISTVCSHFRLPEGHQLTMPELCWWAVVNEVSDLLPDSIARASLRMLPAVMKSEPTRESDITWTPNPTQIIENKVEQVKKVLALKIDDEPPASFIRIPKRQRWENKKWLKWVKSQQCCGCGSSADDPHHIIGHGQGGMGTKAHDLFTIPLCRLCHEALHADMHTWEAEHGSQVVLWFHFMDRSISIGAMA
ncbi:TPA: DUF968 domain-containing protein [Yersinia enterocolitica]|uniref:DUF968 domain-containing protein n=1 Tax=Yersinia enterocolitica TaxID=630 RepID=UPI001E55431E|nr:DUF968 domain-containing protein [Yersinia enterocolitica]EKN5919335.1 DUF968 domain-containing protein [Yersinia enterocolitica]EKN6372945.1 DUF968 domain-containing protein [Yersinia enterocolitica]MCE3106984.1 DUF968 domain-containing protein [Yersinia enterocolitica]MCF3928735.1 DUF968 domain-containing protein [Yersinia enterocolitica]HDL6593188.1 DUF968 domain-containing protein [Yersinia enterocolitica]